MKTGKINDQVRFGLSFEQKWVFHDFSVKKLNISDLKLKREIMRKLDFLTAFQSTHTSFAKSRSEVAFIYVMCTNLVDMDLPNIN